MRNWKRNEKVFFVRFVAGVKSVFISVPSFFRRMARAGGQKVSFMLVPHSGRQAKSYQLSRFGIAVFGLLILVMAGFAVFASSRYLVLAVRFEAMKKTLATTQNNLDSVRDGTETLTGKALKFETRLGQLLAIANRSTATELPSSSGLGTSGNSDEALKIAGLQGLLDMPATQGTASREIARLQGLASYMDNATPDLEKIATLLAGQKEIMSEIPNIWPIQGGIGHISMYYGQNENPFSSGQWYLHNGIDISTFRQGDPIVATADGKVIDASYDSSLGNCVTIQHSHGFLTRYGHLRAFAVKKGQAVTQGQVIGYLGNTGRTTGPHVHYEVHLGTSIIDPLRFLNVRNESPGLVAAAGVGQ
jgi:murein DD-endopeptidase MepM/ murein hydrolase activator NlpD